MPRVPTGLLKRVITGAYRSLLRDKGGREAMDLLLELHEASLDRLAGLDEKQRRKLAGRLFGATIGALEAKRRPGTIAGIVGETIKGLDQPQVFPTLTKLTDLVAVNRRMEDPESLKALQASERPIIVGPWLMEVGFELLYWIPFLRQRLAAAGIPPERVIAISRGGAEPWYRGVAGRYVDLFDFMTPEEFVKGNERLEREQDGKKPFARSAYEQELVETVARQLGLDDYATIFPAAIYRLFRNIWRSRFGGHQLRDHLAFERIPGGFERPAQLPFDEPYVAVKLYYSDCLPETEANARFIARTIARLAERAKVVLLNTGSQLDDHKEAMGEAAGNIVDASRWYGPRDNLTVQTALVANASHLVCTYGGFSYLGPLVDVRTTAFFSATTFVGTHLDLSLQAFDPALGTSLALVPVGGLDETAAGLLLDD